MIEHGIGTTKAHYWVHLFPLPPAPRVFWYRVASCRAFIALYKPPTQIGYSKDGTPTGAGYLIPQSTYFVQAATIPEGYVDHLDWTALTDRESGLRGQEIVLALMEHGIVKFPSAFVAPLNGRADQNQAVDCELRWLTKAKIEIKTERARTANLFVQEREAGHRVNLTTSKQHRHSEFPKLFDEAP